MKELIATMTVFVLIGLIFYCGYDSGYDDAKRKFPTAMDVYQGKTTLQYTIVDGSKIDSVVVFKKN